MKNLSLEGWATQWTRCWVFVCSLGQLLLTFALPGKGALTVEMFSKQVKERMEGSQSKDKVQSTKRPLGTEENLPKLHAAVFLPTTLSSITEQDQVQGSLCERKRKTKQNKKKTTNLSYSQNLPLVNRSGSNLCHHPVQHSYSTAVLESYMWCLFALYNYYLSRCQKVPWTSEWMNGIET